MARALLAHRRASRRLSRPHFQAMLSDSCEFYGNMERHEPADCKLRDVLELAKPRAAAAPAAHAQRAQQPAARQEGGAHAGAAAGGRGPFMYLAQQSLHGPGESGPRVWRAAGGRWLQGGGRWATAWRARPLLFPVRRHDNPNRPSPRHGGAAGGRAGPSHPIGAPHQRNQPLAQPLVGQPHCITLHAAAWCGMVMWLVLYGVA
jgi:hypothetical protein